MKKKLIIITLIIVALYTQTSFAFLGFGKATINGFVKDHFGKPIQGVEVKIKNSRFISTTDKFGKYELEYTPGSFMVVYMKDGYSRYEMKLNLASKEEFPAENVALCKLPVNPGVYFYNNGNLISLKQNRVSIAGTFLESISGINSLSENSTIEKKPLFLIYGDKLPLEHIYLNRLTFMDYAKVQNITGKTLSSINMRTIADKVPYKLIEYSAGQNIGVIQIESPLKLGVYALSWGALHSKDPISASIDKNLVFDFCITVPLSEDDKMEIRNVFNAAESFFKGKYEKEILNKFVYFNSGKGASDSDLRLFTKVYKEADLGALRIINIAPSFEKKGIANVDIEVFLDAKNSTETTVVYVYKIEKNWYLGGIKYAVSVVHYNDQAENAIETFMRELGEGNPYQKFLTRSGLKKFRAYWLHYKKAKMGAKGKKAKQAIDQEFREKNFEFFKIVKRGKYEVKGEMIKDKHAKKVYNAYKKLHKKLRRIGPLWKKLGTSVKY